MDLQMVCRKLDQVRIDIARLRRDFFGDDVESAQKSVLTRLGGLEARVRLMEDSSEKVRSRASKFFDGVVGQLVVTIIVFIAGTMVLIKSLPEDAAAKIRAIQKQP